MPHASSFAIPLWQQTFLQAAVCIIGVTLVCLGGLYYFRRYRIERPPIGTFNGRDITILLAIILALPFLYAILPAWAITCFLCVTFAASLSIGYQRIMNPALFWGGLGLLVGANIYESHFMMGTVIGWQVWWLELDILVIFGAIAVSNLYIQGGMRLKHVAFFAVGLAAYDVFSTLVINVTAVLVEDFVGQPLDPTFGFRFQATNYGIGIGDLLVYALFTIACYKAYGQKAARLAIGISVGFGAAIPSLCPLLIALIDFRNDILIPSQLFFAPAAFVAYLWMRRKYGRERTMAQYLASTDNAAPVTAPEQPARHRSRSEYDSGICCMPGMSPGLNVTDPAVVSAFRLALIHQGLLALTVFALLAVAWLILRRRAGRAGLDLTGASGRTGVEPAGRLVLAVGFGNLWLFDGLLQIQPKMALGLPSLVIEPTAQSSPHWVQALVNWAGTTWSYHPVQAAAATVWIQVGLGLWLLTAPRGLLSRLAGLAGVGWGLVVWIFGESFGGIFAPGQTWLTGAPGAALVYVVAGALIALPERAWHSRRLGRLMLAALGVFLIAMAVLQAWPGRGFWQGVSHGQLGSLAGMAESMALTPQPGFLAIWLGSFASLDAAHGFAVNLFFVLVLAITGVVFASGRSRLIRPVLIAFSMLSLVVWVLVQDLAFLGGLGTDPGSMIPFILLASAGYLELTRPGVAVAPADSAALADPAGEAVRGARLRRRRPSSRVAVASAWSVAALGAVGLIMLGAVPMAVAQASPNADPILAEAIAGPAGLAVYPAPGFALTDQRGQTVTLAALRGKVVVLAFADPACLAGYPPLGREFRQVDELLGAGARLVDFVGIGPNGSAAFEEGLDQVPGWRYLTGTRAQLGRVWRDYGVRSRDGSAVVFVIDSSGHVRRRYQLGTGPGSAATSSSFAVLFASGVRAALVGGR